MSNQPRDEPSAPVTSTGPTEPNETHCSRPPERNGTHALTKLPVGDLGDGADEGAAEELDDRQRASTARGREDEARVLPHVRLPHRWGRPGTGSPEHGQRSIGAERRAAGEESSRWCGPVGAATGSKGAWVRGAIGGRCGAEEVSRRHGMEGSR